MQYDPSRRCGDCGRMTGFGDDHACPDIDQARRFWANVDSSGGADACWPFKGSINNSGYGQVRIGSLKTNDRRMVRSHRYAWELMHGPIPRGLCLLHSCDVRYPVGSIEYRKCCNPAHAHTGSRRRNQEEMKEKGRQARGSRSGTAKLVEADIPAIRAALACGESKRAIAKRHNVSDGLICYVASRRIWGHVE